MKRQKWISLLLCFTLLFMLSACGTMLHPERIDQRGSDRLDPSIVILDGLLCFVFIIPGVVAFVIDFDNRTIYLPSNSFIENNNPPVGVYPPLVR